MLSRLRSGQDWSRAAASFECNFRNSCAGEDRAGLALALRRHWQGGEAKAEEGRGSCEKSNATAFQV